MRFFWYLNSAPERGSGTALRRSSLSRCGGVRATGIGPVADPTLKVPVLDHEIPGVRSPDNMHGHIVTDFDQVAEPHAGCGVCRAAASDATASTTTPIKCYYVSTVPSLGPSWPSSLHTNTMRRRLVTGLWLQRRPPGRRRARSSPPDYSHLLSRHSRVVRIFLAGHAPWPSPRGRRERDTLGLIRTEPWSAARTRYGCVSAIKCDQAVAQ